MPRAASISFRLDPEIRDRLDHLAEAMNRSRSAIIEWAVSDYLSANEWQVQAIHEAVEKADSASANWTDHEELKAKWGK